MLDYYRNETDYGDFLRSIQKLLADGNLTKDEEGYYRVEDNTYKEIRKKK